MGEFAVMVESAGYTHAYNRCLHQNLSTLNKIFSV